MREPAFLHKYDGHNITAISSAQMSAVWVTERLSGGCDGEPTIYVKGVEQESIKAIAYRHNFQQDPLLCFSKSFNISVGETMKLLAFKILSMAISFFTFKAYGQSAPPNSLDVAVAACKSFQEKLSLEANIEKGYAQVPRFYKAPDGEKIKVFWWKRKGSDPSYPPLVHIHGGPGNDSSLVFARLRHTLLQNYPGDFIAWDQRGEGCSKTLPGNLRPENYAPYRANEAVEDIEYLRKNVFQVPKFRIYGQSRGSWFSWLYLERYPDSIESAHISAGVLLPTSQQRQEMTPIRAAGFARLVEQYLKEYPGDENIIKNARKMISPNKCWVGLDAVKTCGPGVLDVLTTGMGRINGSGGWDDIHAKFLTMKDQLTVFRVLQSEVNNDTNHQFGLVVGLNGTDFGNPSSTATRILRHKPVFRDPVLSEIRYIADVISPNFSFQWKGDAMDYDMDKIKKNLAARPGLKVFYYQGEFDPIFTSEIVDWNKRFFGGLVTNIFLPHTGHNDSWYSPATVDNIMVKTF